MVAGIEAQTPRSAVSVGRRRPRRPSVGHLAVVVAALLAFAANIAYLRSLDDSVPVVVAAVPIEAGRIVEPSDLATISIRADQQLLGTLWSTTEGLDGSVARRSIGAGELVGRQDLLPTMTPDGLRAMAVPIDPAHAVGGTIRVGDRVDLVDVDDQGVASFVVRNVEVVEVSAESSGALSGGGRHIVIATSEDDVLAVVGAIADGRVDVVLATGAAGG